MATASSQNGFPVWPIARANLKHNSLFHIAGAGLLFLSAPLLFGIRQLDFQAAAVPMELYAALAGILLLAPVFLPEQNREIHDVVAVKYIGPLWVYGIRFLYSLIILCCMLAAFWLYMRANSCEAEGILLAGTLSEALFLGTMGMFSSSLSGNLVITYMAPMLYYVLNYTGGGSLGRFYLFSMMKTGKPDAKLLQLGAAVLLAGAAFAVKAVRKKQNAS